MQDLIIVGAGGFARELLEIVRGINAAATDGEPVWNVLGFLDDNPDALAGKKCDYKVIGAISDWQPKENEYFALGIAEPHTKEKITAALDARGVKWACILAPTALIAASAAYGRGFVAYPRASLGPDAVVGDFVTLLSTGLGHDAQVGDFCTISSYVGVNGYVKLGKRVYIGSHASLLPNITVGDDGYVGIGSVVVRSVKAGTRVFGNPAKKMDF